MILQSLNILNYRNIREASLEFGDKLNCFVGLNGQGKTNVLDAIYLLSFAKSAFTAQDSLNITHGEEMAMIQGVYREASPQPSPEGKGDFSFTISCGLRKGVKKQFRRDKPEYHPRRRNGDGARKLQAYPRQCSTDSHRQSARAELFTRKRRGG